MSRGRSPKEIAEAVASPWEGDHLDLAGAKIEELIDADDRLDLESTLLAMDCPDLERAIRNVMITVHEARDYERNKPLNRSEAAAYAAALADSCETTKNLLEAELIVSQIYITNISGFDFDRLRSLKDSLQELKDACCTVAEFHTGRPAAGRPKEHYLVIAYQLREMCKQGMIETKSIYSRTGPLVELFNHIVRMAGLKETTSAIHYLKQVFG